MPEQPSQYEWPADAADQCGSPVYRLLWPAVGAELGKVFRSGLGQAAGQAPPGHSGSIQVEELQRNEDTTNHMDARWGHRAIFDCARIGASFLRYVRSDEDRGVDRRGLSVRRAGQPCRTPLLSDRARWQAREG